AARTKRLDQRRKQWPVEVVHDNDHVVLGRGESNGICFEIEDGCDDGRYTARRCFVHLAHHIRIAIDRIGAQPSLGEPECVTATATRDVERIANAWKKTL